MDDQLKEEMRREKRRLQERLRRIKRNEERDKYNPPSSKKKKKVETPMNTKVKEFRPNIDHVCRPANLLICYGGS